MVDITPIISRGSKFIESYSNNGFKISGKVYSGNLLVFPKKVYQWNVADRPDLLEVSHFSRVIGAEDVDILLFGGGKVTFFLEKEVQLQLKEFGIIIECMDTGAACRTYNVLLSEGRKVVVALYTTTNFKLLNK